MTVDEALDYLERAQDKLADFGARTAPSSMVAGFVLAAEVRRLRERLDEAADDMESWGAYADPYFQEKWDLVGDVARLQAEAHGTPTKAHRDGTLW